MVASAMRNMQIPAYSPVLCGVKAVDQSGVVVETKKVIAIESAPIIVISDDDVEVAIELAIDMVPVVVEVISIVIDISIMTAVNGGEPGSDS